MKKSSIILICVVAFVAILILGGVSKYNSLVDSKENVEGKFADISVQLERRADLIPNLVNTVKGYMKHEEGIINDITEARTSLLNASSVSEKSKANDELTKAIDALMVVVENYPDLKASQNFVSLQDELAGTENRISTSRRDYNDAVKKYNSSIKKFPGNIIASMFNFDEEDYFEVTEGKQEVPNVEF